MSSTIQGFSINGVVHKYDYNALANKPTGGLSADVATALLACFEKVAWISADGQDYYDALETALQNAVGTIYSITYALTDCTVSNPATSAAEGSSYTATLSTYSAYEISSVSITMGGTDVTGTTYSSGTISIPNVTGNIVITAVATQRSATLSSISAVYTQSGTVYPTDPIDSLKSDLVVTATWSDTSSSILASSDYTLSGTLTAGTSTVTASYTYGGVTKTATFSVTVTAWDYAWDYSMGKLEEQTGWYTDKSSSGISSSIVTGGEKIAQTTGDRYIQFLINSGGSLASVRYMTTGYGVVECIMSGNHPEASVTNGRFRVAAVKDTSCRISLIDDSGKWRIRNNATASLCTPVADFVNNTEYKIRLVLKNTTADVYINDTLVVEDVDTSTVTSDGSNSMIVMPGYGSGEDYNVILKAFRIKVVNV